MLRMPVSGRIQRTESGRVMTTQHLERVRHLLTQAGIEAGASDEDVRNGKRLLHEGSVLSFESGPGVFSCRVADERLHDVRLEEQGTCLEGTCTCGQATGRCAHVIAALYALKKRLPARASAVGSPGKARGVLEFFRESMHFVPPSGSVSPGLDAILDLRGLFRKERSCTVQLRIQASDGLLVPDPGAFLDAWKARSQMRITDAVLYDPSIWLLDAGEERLLGCLWQLQDAGAALPVQRGLQLTAAALPGVLDALAGTRVGVRAGGDDVKEYFVDGDALNCEYRVRDLSGGDLEIGFVLHNGEFHCSSSAISLLPLQPVWAVAGDRLVRVDTLLALSMQNALHQYTGMPERITVQRVEATTVLEELLPFLERRGRLTMEGRMAKCIKQANRPPRPVVRVDMHELLIRLDLDLGFRYGRERVAWNHPGRLVQSGEYSWQIRRQQDEQHIVDLIVAAGFRADDDGHFVLQDEQKFFEFVYFVLPEHAGQWDVYYNAAFKQAARRLSRPRVGVKLSKKYDFLELSIFPRERGLALDPMAVLESARAGKGYVRLSNGQFLPLSDEQKALLRELAGRVDFSPARRDGRNILTAESIFAPVVAETMRENAPKEDGDIEGDASLEGFSESLVSWKKRVTIPEGINATLREYQHDGLSWLANIYTNSLGGILADDMGLGKTLQTITFIQYAVTAGEKDPFLIVCPSSLVFNWVAELSRFAPALAVLSVGGTPLARQEMYKELFMFHVVVISYNLLQKDQEFLENREFACIFLDEAQHIKNPGSIRTISAKAIRARSRYALTGTPIENCLGELWSLFDFVLPGYLFTYQRFKDEIEKPIMEGSSDEALATLKSRIAPFMLRRTKDEVLTQLPPKTEQVSICPMFDEQKEAYLSVLSFFDSSLLPAIEKDGVQKHSLELLAALTRLRQICCHPGLALEKYGSATSGKMELIFEIMNQAVDGGHKTLIFSQFTGMLDLIEQRLGAEGFSVCRLDGSTNVKHRGEIVKRFNEDSGMNAFLISLKAGGTGLNLTTADTVIHVDPWWNPAAEDQASARAWRMGQTRPVMVYKLIAEGTVEEKILALQQDKKRLVQAVIGDSPVNLSRLTLDQIKDLFKRE